MYLTHQIDRQSGDVDVFNVPTAGERRWKNESGRWTVPSHSKCPPNLRPSRRSRLLCQVNFITTNSFNKWLSQISIKTMNRETRRCVVVRFAHFAFDSVHKFGISQRHQLGSYTFEPPHYWLIFIKMLHFCVSRTRQRRRNQRKVLRHGTWT